MSLSAVLAGEARCRNAKLVRASASPWPSPPHQPAQVYKSRSCPPTPYLKYNHDVAPARSSEQPPHCRSSSGLIPHTDPRPLRWRRGSQPFGSQRGRLAKRTTRGESRPGRNMERSEDRGCGRRPAKTRSGLRCCGRQHDFVRITLGQH